MDPDQQRVGIVEVVVFLAELVLLAGLAWAGARLAHGVLAVVLAIVLPALAALLWGVLLAPRAARRLPHPARLIVKLALVLAAAVLLALSGELVWAIVLVAVTATPITVAELRDRPGKP
jgi:hypothetical protein